ncbi:MAG: type II toxin-antitoxin system HicB family antitoxin [Bacillota bacterium]|nr:type II toxin-antitoxin system HicB family antitoxin [Bacillota bacterium]
MFYLVTLFDIRLLSKCIDNNVASQGKTIEEALSNLREALELYFENEKPKEKNIQTFITTMEAAI